METREITPAELDILTTLRRVHVTDRLTGLVYTDLDTFICNVNSQSVPCLWDVFTSDGSVVPLGGLADQPHPMNRFLI